MDDNVAAAAAVADLRSALPVTATILAPVWALIRFPHGLLSKDP